LIDEEETGVGFQALEGDVVHDVVAVDLPFAVCDAFCEGEGGGGAGEGGVEFPLLVRAVSAFF